MAKPYGKIYQNNQDVLLDSNSVYFNNKTVKNELTDLNNSVDSNNKSISSINTTLKDNYDFTPGKEYKIGTWSGGVPLYRKTLQFNTTSTTVDKSYSTGLKNVHIINMYGTVRGGSYTIPINFYNGKIVFLHTNRNGDILYCNNGYETGMVTVVLEYVKT